MVATSIITLMCVGLHLASSGCQPALSLNAHCRIIAYNGREKLVAGVESRTHTEA